MGDKEDTKSREMAVEMGRRGGRKGGKARAALMTAEERKAAAQLAAQSRWDEKKGVQRALCEGTIKLGAVELECAVLPGGVRVLSQRAIMKSLNRYRPGGRGVADDSSSGPMPRFLAAKNLQAFVSDDLRQALAEQILYRGLLRGNGQPAQGTRAELLADICVVYLDAEKARALKPQQLEAAKAADILHRGLAKIGITALVDEATGYQYDRARNALAEILESFIAKELAKWAKTFSDDFYKELFRLRKLKTDDIKKRPQYFGNLTNEIVYSRLAPGVLEELRKKNPTDDHGNRKNKHFQWLTPDVGSTKLREHLAKATALMQISTEYRAFIALLNRIAPKIGTSYLLPGIE
jgi:P63C domain-containing protein